MSLVRSAAGILLFLVGSSAACHADDLLSPFLGAPVFEKQRLFDDQRYPNVVVTTKGTVLAVWGNDGVVVRRSEDGGKSWGRAISVANAGYHGGGTTVDGNSGDILVFVEDWQPPAPLTVYRSRDDGKTWPIKRLVDAGRSGYSSLAVGRHDTPTAGWLYLHYEHDPFKGAHLARFNLTWVLGGERTGDGEVPKLTLQ